MLQNTRVTAFTISDLLRENQQVGKIPAPPPHTHTKLGLRFVFCSENILFLIICKQSSWQSD